jgi:cytoskeleton protein RodZ
MDDNRNDTLSIDPDMRMDAQRQGDLHENDDALTRHPIDKPNETDKYSGYEVSLHDNNELPSAKDNLKANEKESNGSYADLNNDSTDTSADTDHLSHSDEEHNESLNNLSHPNEGPHEIKESIDPDIRMNAHQLKMPEDDDTLVHDKIDTLNDTDKYSSYEVSIHDDNETPPSAKDNIKENSADFKTSAIERLTTEPQTEIETHQKHEAKKAFDDIKKNDDTYPGSTQLDNAIDTTMSPGGRLRLIREQNNMSVKHVADRLYLDARVIEALEADNYEKLPPTLFVRGYLRNYAKLMDISPESIMSSFEANHQKSAPSLTAPFQKKKQASRHDLWPTVVTIVVIVTLMILMALWQFYPSTAIDEFPLSNSPEESSWLSGTDFEHDTNNITEIDETRIAAGDQNMTVSSTIVESPPAIVSVIQPEINTPPRSAEKDNTIKMHFKQKVWMRITDKTKKQLYQGIGKAGEVLSLDGLPPFKMRVGNTGVDIEYKGEIKNINEYPGQGRAFIVGVE